MDQSAITAIFDQQAAGYDAQWARTAAIRDCLYLLLDAMFTGLPADARILCVGVGTGTELGHLARTHPGWRFTAVEPSGRMLEVCRRRAEAEGFSARCRFHEGYLDALEDGADHDAATCFLVSQFIVDPRARTAFFAQIARRLRPGGLLASADLAADVDSPDYEVLLRAWAGMMAAAAVPPEALARMRAAYATDVGVLPPTRIASIIAAGGFAPPVLFFQAGLMHAWRSERSKE